jgi:hydroxymethylpyrimidine kinase/phosphomethylpyrimidine kinase
MVAVPPIALSIAGSDPTGGAGLQLDLRVFAHFGVHGMAVPTALTLQNTARVQQVLPVFPSVVRDQLVTLLQDVAPRVLKIGMLASDDVLLRVASVLEHWEIPRVVDPVLRASDGTRLLESRALGNLADRVVRGAALVTPNLDEADALTGTRDPERAARVFLEMGAAAVLIKGGHREGAPDDYLCTSDGSLWLRGTRSAGDPVHGTGCALSAAIAALLARGLDLEDAVRRAKSFVAHGIEHAFAAGKGQRLLHWPAAAGAADGGLADAKGAP